MSTVGFDCNTLYAAQAGTGYQIPLDEPRRFVGIQTRNGGVFWVRRRSALDGAGSIPTSPVPGSNGIVVKGWIRIGDDEVISWGRDVDVATHVPTAARIAVIDVWCETGGDLIVNPS